MCGIGGVAHADPERPVDVPALRRMCDVVRYRGPDSDGYHVAPGIGLGIRRLAINDLVTGDQPIASEDGQVIVVCNGEIYNFVELRHDLERAGHRFRTRSDVEVIVHLYEDEGPACLRRLRGMFGLALWDQRRRQLLLARDRLGIKPLHYATTVTGDTLLFGSEQKSILAGGDVDRAPDPRALADVFTLGFVAGARTFCRGIHRLPPGHLLLYRQGHVHLEQYWDIPFPAPEDAAADDRPGADETWATALAGTLDEAVRLHVRSDTPVGAWLSPGLDSSSVVSLMRAYVPSPIATFTLAFDNPRCDETATQPTLDTFPGFDLTNERAVCRLADFARLPAAFWHAEDPAFSGMEVPRLILSELAARRVKVVMTGEGADEVFGGYHWFRLEQLTRPLARLPLSLRRLALIGGLLPRLRPRFARSLVAPPVMGRARYEHLVGLTAGLDLSLFSPAIQQQWPDPEELAADGPRLPDRFERWDPFAQLQYFDLKWRLPEYIMHRVDRMSMACSLEARLPFLDHEVVELCARLPTRLKMRWLNEKYILRRAMRDVTPPAIRQRRKRPLIAPGSEWLRAPLPEFATTLLATDHLRATGYFEPAAVARLLAAHRAGQADHSATLLGILNVQLWDTTLRRGRQPAAESPSGVALHGTGLHDRPSATR